MFSGFARPGFGWKQCCAICLAAAMYFTIIVGDFEVLLSTFLLCVFFQCSSCARYNSFFTWQREIATARPRRMSIEQVCAKFNLGIINFTPGRSSKCSLKLFLFSGWFATSLGAVAIQWCQILDVSSFIKHF